MLLPAKCNSLSRNSNLLGERFFGHLFMSAENGLYLIQLNILCKTEYLAQWIWRKYCSKIWYCTDW